MVKLELRMPQALKPLCLIHFTSSSRKAGRAEALWLALPGCNASALPALRVFEALEASSGLLL